MLKKPLKYEENIKILSQEDLKKEQKYLISCISDTHLQKPKVQTSDLIIHSGDLFNYNSSEKIMPSMEEFLGKLPAPKLIMVPGNHDRLFCQNKTDKAEKNKKLFIKNLNSDKHFEFLDNKESNFQGYKIFGFPHSIKRRIGAGAFQVENSKQMEEKVKKIPIDVDILITHGPPFGIGDIAKNAHQGSKALRAYVDTHKPKFHIFGHIHEARGIYEHGGTIFINAGIWDAKKTTLNEPIYFYLPEKNL